MAKKELFEATELEPRPSEIDGVEASRARLRRGDLSKDLIMAKALKMIGADGLEAFSMRRLGDSLGASTMGVYRHFKNKAELLDAIVDRLLDDKLAKPVSGTWQAQLKTVGMRVRKLMLSYPDLAPMMGTQFRKSPVSLKINAELIEQLSNAGLPDFVIAETYWAVAVYTNGYALLESSAARSAPSARSPIQSSDRVTKWRALMESVGEIGASTAEKSASVLAHPIDDAQFMFGLDCLLVGIERRIESQSAR